MSSIAFYCICIPHVFFLYDYSIMHMSCVCHGICTILWENCIFFLFSIVCGNYVIFLFLYILFNHCSHGSCWKVFVNPLPFHLMPGGMCKSINAILNGTHEPDHNFDHALIYVYSKYMYTLICNQNAVPTMQKIWDPSECPWITMCLAHDSVMCTCPCIPLVTPSSWLSLVLKPQSGLATLQRGRTS